MLQVYGGKGEQKHRQIQFGGSAQQVIIMDLWPFNDSRITVYFLCLRHFCYYYHCFPVLFICLTGGFYHFATGLKFFSLTVIQQCTIKLICTNFACTFLA